MSEPLPDLPPYTYVPGHAAHPVSHPNGHARNRSLPSTWSLRDHFRWGQRLFEHGYYWEAHEAWEPIWLEMGRTSGDALIVKGLIKLAASGVKCREGNAAGAIRHATRALELLRSTPGCDLFEDCDLNAAQESAGRVAASPPTHHTPASDQPVPLPGLRISSGC